jgi:mycofactocin precursor
MLQEAAMNPENEQQEELVAEDLIEEVSIDGMCGVY